MNYNLNNNAELIRFFNELFKNEYYATRGPAIMKFFIITRNYGLIDFYENLEEIMNAPNTGTISFPDDIAFKVIKKGFERDNIPFNNANIISLAVNNYHQNGFYIHSFPGVYKNRIRQNGLLANSRNEKEAKYYEILKKYNFHRYYLDSNNRICFLDKLTIQTTHGYSLETPEWLKEILGYGNDQEYINDAFERGNTEEMKSIAKIALEVIKREMIEKSTEANIIFDERDYKFLENYINEVIEDRFKEGNNTVGIALIERKKVSKYLGTFITEHHKLELIDHANKYFNERQSFDFIIEKLTKGEFRTDISIPPELINIVSYQLYTDKRKIIKS